MDETPKKTPLILDTDIGSDIDDVWALVMLLRSPEVDVRLITTAHGNTTYRAKIVARLLEIAGRTDIPIGIGEQTSAQTEAQEAWVADYDLNQYPGTVYRDGVRALIDTVMDTAEQTALVAIGPLTNIASALEIQPAIAKKARFIGMHGSIRKGYGNAATPVAEYNVAVDAAACRAVFTAPWDVTITPLDTCGLIQLTGERYQKIRNSRDILVQALMENYRIWEAAYTGNTFSQGYGVESTILFDTAAAYLAFSEELLDIETLGVEVTEDGYTRVAEGAKVVRCATAWRDRDAFLDLLVQRLLNSGAPV